MQVGPIFKNQIYQRETLHNKRFPPRVCRIVELNYLRLSLRTGFNSPLLKGKATAVEQGEAYLPQHWMFLKWIENAILLKHFSLHH